MLAFVLIYVAEWLIKLVLIPGIHLFLVLEDVYKRQDSGFLHQDCIYKA